MIKFSISAQLTFAVFYFILSRANFKEVLLCSYEKSKAYIKSGIGWPWVQMQSIFYLHRRNYTTDR